MWQKCCRGFKLFCPLRLLVTVLLTGMLRKEEFLVEKNEQIITLNLKWECSFLSLQWNLYVIFNGIFLCEKCGICALHCSDIALFIITDAAHHHVIPHAIKTGSYFNIFMTSRHPRTVRKMREKTSVRRWILSENSALFLCNLHSFNVGKQEIFDNI